MSSWRRIFVANGNIEAEQVRAFLEAHDIKVFLRGEAIRTTHGLTIDGLGAVVLEVAESDEHRARELLADADAGKFRIADDTLRAD